MAPVGGFPFDVNVTIRQLHSCWKPIRNPGSAEDNTQHKAYLEELAHCGGLNPSIWKRGEFEEQKLRRQPFLIAFSPIHQSPIHTYSQLSSPATDLSCVWSACTTSSTSSLASLLPIESSSLIFNEAESESADSTILLTAQIKKSEEKISVEPTIQIEFPPEPKQWEANWTALFVFLAIIFLHRFFLSPTAGGNCSAR